MDTIPYSNILKAVNQPVPDYGAPATTAPASSQTTASLDGKPKLSLDQQAKNYDTFSEIMRQGIYLPDLIKSIDDLKTEVEKLKRSQTTEVDAELFAAMESSVKGDPDVRKARQHMADIKTLVLTELCMNDPRFREARDEYRRAVNRAYVGKDRAEPGRDAEVRENA